MVDEPRSTIGNVARSGFGGPTILFRAAEALKEAGNLMLEAKSDDSAALSRQKVQQRWERIVIGWLLDTECSLKADIFEGSTNGNSRMNRRIFRF